MQQSFAGKKITTITFGREQNEEVISNIQTGMFWQIRHKIAQFYWKTSLKTRDSPHLSSVWRTYTRRRHMPSRNDSNIESKTPFCVSLKQYKAKKRKRKSVSCLVRTSVWLMNPLANDLKQQSSQGTDVFTDRRSARNAQASTTENGAAPEAHIS